jgi:CrcB protein
MANRFAGRHNHVAVQFFVIGLGAVLGSNLRFLVGTWAAERFGPGFPYGTFLVNVSGAFAVGIVLAFLTERLGVDPLWRLFFVTGFLGGYTTFSSYAWEALALAESGAWLRAGGYVIGSNLLGFFGVWLGATLARLTPG